MRYEELQGVKIPKVGFGTWSIGGETHADRRHDEASLSALRSALELGYTHFDTAESYAGGHTEELLGRAIHDAQVGRAGLFLASKVRGENLSSRGVAKACEGSLRRLGTEYLDLYLIHWPNATVRLQDTFAGLNALVEGGKVRHLGVSNFDQDLLGRARAESHTPLITNQIPYSVAERSYVKNGVLEYCQAADILVTAYSPVKEMNSRASPALLQVAARRSVSPQQAAIAWLCSQPRVITIPTSADPSHQRANLEAADIVFSHDEIAAIALEAR
jgi:diketogulonate reductase-like aldo/keto reductase